MNNLSPSPQRGPNGEFYVMSGKRGFCYICSLDLTSPQHCQQHITGKQHIKKETEMSRPSVTAVSDHSAMVNPGQPQFTSPGITVVKNRGPNGEVYDRLGQGGTCFACGVLFTSPEHATQHVQGQKHKKKVAQGQLDVKAFPYVAPGNFTTVSNNLTNVHTTATNIDHGVRPTMQLVQSSVGQRAGLYNEQIQSNLTSSQLGVAQPGPGVAHSGLLNVEQRGGVNHEHIQSNTAGFHQGGAGPVQLHQLTRTPGYIPNQALGPQLTRSETPSNYIGVSNPQLPVYSLQTPGQQSLQGAPHTDTSRGQDVTRPLPIGIPVPTNILPAVGPGDGRIAGLGSTQHLPNRGPHGKTHIMSGGRGYCYVCNLELTSDAHAKSHLEGKKHLKKCSEDTSSFHVDQSGSVGKIGNILMCSICDVPFSCPKNAEEHFRSEKHKKKAMNLSYQSNGPVEKQWSAFNPGETNVAKIWQSLYTSTVKDEPLDKLKEEILAQVPEVSCIPQDVRRAIDPEQTLVMKVWQPVGKNSASQSLIQELPEKYNLTGELIREKHEELSAVKETFSSGNNGQSDPGQAGPMENYSHTDVTNVTETQTIERSFNDSKPDVQNENLTHTNSDFSKIGAKIIEVHRSNKGIGDSGKGSNEDNVGSGTWNNEDIAGSEKGSFIDNNMQASSKGGDDMTGGNKLASKNIILFNNLNDEQKVRSSSTPLVQGVHSELSAPEKLKAEASQQQRNDSTYVQRENRGSHVPTVETNNLDRTHGPLGQNSETSSHIHPVQHSENNTNKLTEQTPETFLQTYSAQLSDNNTHRLTDQTPETYLKMNPVQQSDNNTHRLTDQTPETYWQINPVQMSDNKREGFNYLQDVKPVQNFQPPIYSQERSTDNEITSAQGNQQSGYTHDTMTNEPTLEQYYFNGNTGYCYCCSVQLTSVQHANQHLLGQKHKKKLNQPRLAYKIPSTENNGTATHWLQFPPSTTANTTGDNDTSYNFNGIKGFCYVCQIELTSYAHAQQHINGKPHKRLKSRLSQTQSGNVYPLACQVCSKLFTGQESAAQHFTSSKHKHKEELMGGSVEIYAKGDVKVVMKDCQWWYFCQICKVYLNTNEQLAIHKESPRHKECENLLKISALTKYQVKESASGVPEGGVKQMVDSRASTPSSSQTELEMYMPHLDNSPPEDRRQSLEEADRDHLLEQNRLFLKYGPAPVVQGDLPVADNTGWPNNLKSIQSGVQITASLSEVVRDENTQERLPGQPLHLPSSGSNQVDPHTSTTKNVPDTNVLFKHVWQQLQDSAGEQPEVEQPSGFVQNLSSGTQVEAGSAWRAARVSTSPSTDSGAVLSSSSSSSTKGRSSSSTVGSETSLHIPPNNGVRENLLTGFSSFSDLSRSSLPNNNANSMPELQLSVSSSSNPSNSTHETSIASSTAQNVWFGHMSFPATNRNNFRAPLGIASTASEGKLGLVTTNQTKGDSAGSSHAPLANHSVGKEDEKQLNQSNLLHQANYMEDGGSYIDNASLEDNMQSSAAGLNLGNLMARPKPSGPRKGRGSDRNKNEELTFEKKEMIESNDEEEEEDETENYNIQVAETKIEPLPEAAPPAQPQRSNKPGFRFYCQVCDKHMNTREAYQSHAQGKLHIYKLSNCRAPARNLGAILKVADDPSLVEQAFTIVNPASAVKPRPYQIELVEKAMLADSVIYLPTGTGKTLVAVLVMGLMLQYNPSRPVLFLVDKVLLVMQQTQYINKHLLGVQFKRESESSNQLVERELKVKPICGRMTTKTDLPVWKHDIIVTTAAYCNNMLDQGIIRWEDFSLVVLDEVHHCHKGHPYLKLMSGYHRKLPESCRGKVLGLTASPAGKSTVQLTYIMLNQLLMNLGGATIAVVEDHQTCLNTYQSMAKVSPRFVPMSSKEYEFKRTLLEYFILCYTELATMNPFLKSDQTPYSYFADAINNRGDKEIAGRLAERFIKDPESILEVTNAIFQAPPVPQNSRYENLRLHVMKLLLTIPEIGSIGDIEELTKALSPESPSIQEFEKMGLPCKQMYNKVEIFESDGCNDLTMFSGLVNTLKDSTYVNWSDPKSRALVLVRERKRAKQYSIKLKASQMVKEKNLLVGYIVGHGKGAKDGGMDLKKQRRMFDNHDKYHILVATSIMEEGIDIQALHLVVCMNPPSSLRALVQMRGRARREDSHFVVLCSSQEELDKLQSLERQEKNMAEAAKMCLEQRQSVT